MDTRITKEEMDEWDREHGFAVDAEDDEDLDDEPDDGSRYDDLLIYDSKPFDPLELVSTVKDLLGESALVARSPQESR